MKKIISIILAVIMIVSAVPLQSLAVGPELVKVEAINNLPISNNYVQDNHWYSSDETDESVLVNLGSNYTYGYRLYFANGRVLDTLEGSFAYELALCGISSYYINTFIDREACQKAIDEGKSTVKVTVSVKMIKIGGKEEVKEFEIEQAIAEGIVKNIELIGTMPEFYDDESLREALDGRQFEIEYYDGKKETLTLKDCYFGEDFVYITGTEEEKINEETGEKVFCRNIKLEYIDWNAPVAKEEIVCPFEEVEILDFKVNRKAQLQSVRYRITYKDGRTVEKTNTFKVPINIADKVVIDNIDGYPIKAFLYVHETIYVFQVSAGYDIWGVGDGVDGEAKDVCNCICHRNGIMYLISLFLIGIWKIFRTRMICQCGDNHWYW